MFRRQILILVILAMATFTGRVGTICAMSETQASAVMREMKAAPTHAGRSQHAKFSRAPGIAHGMQCAMVAHVDCMVDIMTPIGPAQEHRVEPPLLTALIVMMPFDRASSSLLPAAASESPPSFVAPPASITILRI